MFEKWFGKKGSDKVRNAVEGVAHVDGSFEETRFNSDFGNLQDEFSEHDGKQFKKDQTSRSWRYDDDKKITSMKVSNERKKPKLGELHSDVKEIEINGQPEPIIAEEVLDLMEKEEDSYTDLNKAA